MENKENGIKIITKITYDMYKKYCKFSLFRGKFYKIEPPLIYIVSAIVLLLSLSLGLSYGFEVMDIAVILIFTIITVVLTVMLFVLPKLYYKSSKISSESTNEYKFFEEYLTIESDSELVYGSSRIGYAALYRIYEVDDFIFIYISNAQAFIVPKENCSPSDVDELRNILQGKVKIYKDYSKKDIRL